MSNICTPILVGLAFFGDIATFQIWSIIMNPFSLSLPLSPLLSSSYSPHRLYNRFPCLTQ